MTKANFPTPVPSLPKKAACFHCDQTFAHPLVIQKFYRHLMEKHQFEPEAANAATKEMILDWKRAHD